MASWRGPDSSGVGTGCEISLGIWIGQRAGAGTGIPEDWIMERCVAEKVRWPASLAVAKRLATRDERLSERPNCMVVE